MGDCTSDCASDIVDICSNKMIAFIKLWIFAIILLQNYIFMNHINNLDDLHDDDNFSSIDKKLYLTLFSIIRLVTAAKLETTYHAVMKFGLSLFYSPLFLMFLIWF